MDLKYTIPFEIFSFEMLETADDDALDSVQRAQVPMGKHLFVEVEVDGNALTLVLDTGASQTIFDPELIADSLDFFSDLGEIQSSGINSEVEMSAGYVRNLQIGELFIPKMFVGLTSLAQVNLIYKRVSDKQIAGLLGSEILEKYRAIIDYGTRTLTLFETVENPEF